MFGTNIVERILIMGYLDNTYPMLLHEGNVFPMPLITRRLAVV